MKYPFSVYQTQVEDHIFWVAECKDLKGCVAQGENIEEALAELETNEAEWLETAEKYGIAIPSIPIEDMLQYSGKFTMRISPAVHKEAAERAKKEGISLNQYVNDAIVAKNSALTASDAICNRVNQAVKEAVTDVMQDGTVNLIEEPFYSEKSTLTYSRQRNQNQARPVLAFV